MSIDYSWMIELTTAPERRPEPEQPDISERMHGGIKKIQGDRKAEQAALGRALEVYRTYNDNIVKVSQIMTGILRGADGGENYEDLFLEAARALSILTNDNIFYRQIEEAARRRRGE